MRILLSLAAVIGLVGCVGGIDTPPVGDDGSGSGPGPGSGSGTVEGKKLFDQDVYPIIARAGMCADCHTTGMTKGGAPATAGFVDANAATAYTTILGYPAVHGNFAVNAKILTYVTVNGHQGKTYTADEKTKIEGWLAKELVERAGGGGGGTDTGPGAVTEKLLQQFSGCMTQTNFDTANMADACGNMRTNNNSACETCHSIGGNGHVASRQSLSFFGRISTNRTYMQRYFMVANATTPATAKIDLNLPEFQAVLSGTGAFFQHERVNNPTNNQCTQAMQTFYTATMAAITAAPGGSCGPSKLID